MTDHEQAMFNTHADDVKAFEWRDRTLNRLMRRLEPLNSHDKILLLRKIDEVIG